MVRRKFSITELSCVVHESYPYSSDRRETKFAIPKIIEALLWMAESGELPVSFNNGSDPGAVHTTLAGTPYKWKKGATQAAKTRNDLRGVHYKIIPIKGGWGIQDITAGFDDWCEYWADKEDKKDDGGDISDEGLYALGETMLVSKDDWSSFEKGSVFQDWIGDNAPPTEEQVEEFWPTDDGSAEADLYHTGGQGRPTVSHLVKTEFERRIDEKLVEPNLTAEALALQKWVKGKHPEGPPMTARTIENTIRPRYNKLPKNPTK